MNPPTRWMQPLGLVLLGLALTGCQRGAAPERAEKITPVRVAPVTLGPASPTLSLHGLLAHQDEARLSFKLPGLIRRIPVTAGEHVLAGQRLAELEPAEIDAQLSQAAQLDTKAARDLARGERLFADDVISLEQVQNLRTQRELAAAQLQAARFNQQHAVIRAPGAGVVLRKLAEEHELMGAGQPVLLFGADRGGFVVRTALADRQLGDVHLGDVAEVSLDALPERVLAARISQISGAADPGTGLFPIEVRLERLDAALASGLVATVRLGASAGAAQLARVPIGAIVQADASHAVLFELQGERARARSVQIAFIDGDQVALRSGPAPGTPIITAGAGYLDDNSRVRVTGP